MKTPVLIASEQTMDEAKGFALEFYHVEKNALHQAMESNGTLESDTSMVSKYDADIAGNSQLQWGEEGLTWNLYASVLKEGKHETVFFSFTRQQKNSHLYVSSEEHPTPQSSDITSFRAFKQMEELLMGFGY